MARRDYFYDPEAPKPNSIHTAAAVTLFDSSGNILLLRRKDNDKWTMPGGTLDFGESLTSCVIRKVREETGIGKRSRNSRSRQFPPDPDVRLKAGVRQQPGASGRGR
jgi:8-oxo-dGTP pyrophosphatase MutT (NUDIX family)